MKTPKPEHIQVTVEVQPFSAGPPYEQYRVRYKGRRWVVEHWVPYHGPFQEITVRSLRRLLIGLAKAEIKRIARL